MKFFKGELVKIKNNTNITNLHYYPNFVTAMENYHGRTTEVTEVFFRQGIAYYKCFGYSWSADWLDKIEFLTDKDFEL